MSDLYMRKNILIRGFIGEDGSDFRQILEMKKTAEELARQARRFKDYKFDNTDGEPKPGEITISMKYKSEKALKHAERLLGLMDEVAEEAREFYRSVGLEVEGSGGKIMGQII